MGYGDEFDDCEEENLRELRRPGKRSGRESKISGRSNKAGRKTTTKIGIEISTLLRAGLAPKYATAAEEAYKTLIKEEGDVDVVVLMAAARVNQETAPTKSVLIRQYQILLIREKIGITTEEAEAAYDALGGTYQRVQKFVDKYGQRAVTEAGVRKLTEAREALQKPITPEQYWRADQVSQRLKKDGRFKPAAEILRIGYLAESVDAVIEGIDLFGPEDMLTDAGAAAIRHAARKVSTRDPTQILEKIVDGEGIMLYVSANNIEY